MLDRISAIDEPWVKGLPPETQKTVLRMASHQDNARFDKISYPWSWWSFWYTTCKVFLCVFPFYEVKPVSVQYDKLFPQYHLRRVVRPEAPELFESAVIVHDNAAAHSACT